MADRTLTDVNAAEPILPSREWTYLKASATTSIPKRSITVNKSGYLWEASYSQTYEGCTLAGVSESVVDKSLDDEDEQRPRVIAGGPDMRWNVGIFTTDALADAARCFRGYFSGASDGVAQSDLGKTVYAKDGRTLAVADAATAANRPHSNAVPFGEITEVTVTGTSGRVVVRQFTAAEAKALGNYFPTGNPLRGVNPYNGHIGTGAQPNVWVTDFRQPPQLNTTSAIASGGAVSATTTAALAAAGRDLELSGVGASDGDVTYGTSMQLVVQTDNSDGDQILLFPHQDTLATSLAAGVLTDNSPCYGIILKSKTAITSRRIKVGLVLTTALNVTTDNDQVFASYGTDASDPLGITNWNLAYSIGGTDTAPASSGVAVAIDAIVRIEIRVNSARLASLWIDGVKTNTSTALTTAVSLKWYFGLEAGTTNEPIVELYAGWCGQLTS